MSLTNAMERNATFCENYNRFSMPGSLIEEDTPSLPFLNWLFPVVLVTILGAIFRWALQPFGQAFYVAQMLAGIVIGPSFMGKSKKLSNQMFSPKITSVLNCFDTLGIVYMCFTISARTDVNIIKKSGRLAVIIGILAFMIPLIANMILNHILNHVMQFDELQSKTLLVVASLEATVSFQVIFNILSELKLLNSELGRLALSSSLISNLLTLVNTHSLRIKLDSKTDRGSTILYKSLCFIGLMSLILFALRPTSIWMMKQTPEGKFLKHAHVFAIHLMVLGCSIFGEIAGITPYLGPTIFGAAIPVNPPMGTCLTDKFDYFVLAVLMPCFMANLGRQVDLFSLELRAFLAYQSIILVSIVSRFLSVMAASLYYRVPFMDALSLALLLNCRGIYDVQLFSRGVRNKRITQDSYAILVATSIFRSITFIPAVRYLYDSSRRYVAYRRRTIQHNGQQAELRILACIHEPDDVPLIINILEDSNHPETPVGIYVMKLEEYIGSYIPIVIQHRLDQIPYSSYRKVNFMIEAFRRYQERNTKHVSVQCFTAIAPYASMHDDICLMAFDKSTSLVIIPYHKTNDYFTKIVIKNVLKLSPCSVGLLFDRCKFGARSIFSSQQTLNVCVVYLGGPDDCEALAYGVRMVWHHNIWLQVLRFIGTSHASSSDLLEEKQHIFGMINDFRNSNVDRKKIEYVEQIIAEGSQTVWKLNSIGNDFNLILVGRRHNNHSNVLLGLSEWCENDELGIVGDILASTDYPGKASVMVIQQQASVVEAMLESQNRSTSFKY